MEGFPFECCVNAETDPSLPLPLPTTAGTDIAGSGNKATVPLLEASMLEAGSAAEGLAIDSTAVESSSCISLMIGKRVK